MALFGLVILNSKIFVCFRRYFNLISMRQLLLLLFVSFCLIGLSQTAKDTIVTRNNDTIFCYVVKVSAGYIHYVDSIGSSDTIMQPRLARKDIDNPEIVDNIIYCSAYKRFHVKSSATLKRPASGTVSPTGSSQESSGHSSTCPSVQCSGRTQQGNRCKRTTTNCSGRCYQH